MEYTETLFAIWKLEIRNQTILLSFWNRIFELFVSVGNMFLNNVKRAKQKLKVK